MSNSGELLDSAEVEFLLDSASDLDEAQVSSEQSLENQEVTMSGDLDKINLTDIIQTLTLSKMEGLMRLRNPLEQRQLFFHEGFVRVLAPNRVETKRLGQRLIRSGHLNVEQLRSALLLQKKTHQHLGEILVKEGLVDEADIEGLVVMQVEEDLLSVFTWHHGTFEFFKGPVTDLDLRRRLELTPEFDANGVLLEVARREDDWKMIMETVGSLDEIVIRTEMPVPSDLDSDRKIVLDEIDGRRSVRDISDVTLLQIFECARAMRELFKTGLADRIDIGSGLELARSHLEQGNSKLAMVTVRALADRPGPWATETTLELAELLHRCGQHRWAGELVVEAAKAETDEEAALDLARRARKISSRSLDVLKFLYDRLSAGDQATSEECADVVSDLVEGLIEEKQLNEALFLLVELEKLAPGNTNTLSRKAQVLAKLDRGQEAVGVLLILVDAFKKERSPEKLANVYEQILKIDFRRKDIAKALKILHASQFTKRIRVALYASVLFAVSLCSYWWIGEQQKASLISELESTVSSQLRALTSQLQAVDSLLAKGNDKAAMDGIKRVMASVQSLSGTVQDATSNYGEIDALARLQRSLDSSLSEANRRKNELILATQTDLVNLAQEKLDDGNLIAAMQLFEKLDGELMNRDSMEDAARHLLIPYVTHISSLVDTLPVKIPDLPNLLQTHTEREAILETLIDDFPDSDRRLIAGFLSLADDGRLRSIIGESYFADAQKKSAILKVIFADAASVREAYLVEVMRTRTAQRLTPLFRAAKDYEQNFEFEKARAAYEKLARNHPDKDPLWRHFQNQVEKYATILRFIQVLDQATARGDFKTARGQLRTLIQAFPNIPFEHLSRLPIHVRTQPDQAQVYFDGKNLGISPLIGSYFPGAETRIRIELDGFYPEETMITGDLKGIVKSLLTKRPDWSFQTGSAIDRPPVIDELGYVFVVDRGGVITALDLDTGNMLWSLRTGDLSGLLPTPTLTDDDCLVVASADGDLRCLARKSGKIRWQIEDLPSESRPLSRGGTVMVATNDGRLIGIDNRSGQVRFSIDLDGPVRADLLNSGNKIFAITIQGSVFCIDPSQGTVLWQEQAGDGVFCTPVLAQGKLAVVSDSGRITVFDADTGKLAWEVYGLGELTLSPVAVDRSLFVVDHKRILKFDLHSGKRLGQTTNREIWSSHLGSGAGMIFAGDRSGLLQVLDAKDLSPLFRIRSTKPPIAAMVFGKSGKTVAVFEDRMVHGFLKLR